MADDLFNSLRKKEEKKKSLIESLIDSNAANKKETETKDNDIINVDKEKKDEALFDDIDTSLESSKREIVFDEKEVKEEKKTVDSTADDLLAGATGMRVLSFDDEEEEENQQDEETNEKTVKINAMTADDIRKIEYVIYLLSSRNFSEAIDYIEKWRNE